MNITNQIKEDLAKVLSKLPATSNGTEIRQVVLSGEDAFEAYPVIRVIPLNVRREIRQASRAKFYEISFIISVYLEMGDLTVPDSEIIGTMSEIVDNIVFTLDNTDWVREELKDGLVCENNVDSSIDIIATKTGSALCCDLTYPVAYETVI